MDYELKTELELIKLNERKMNEFKVPFYNENLLKYHDELYITPY